MPVINILSPHVADMIAAGEVVERPASVVKELMENSFDAGAHSVTVELRGGGTTYIRVTDDGCGMAPEDAGVAFLRHATSQLHDERGLEAIGTMGFRGEALAAISAVSHVELRTRRRGDGEGTLVTLTAGEIEDMLPTGCPEGTTMIVRDLFYNTPARLKFLKSDRSEGSACALAALRCALGRPGISVRLIKDGREEFFSPGDGREDSCVYALLGRDAASSMLRCSGDMDGMKLSGFVSSPSAGRGNRAQQYFYVNGRFIRSQLLQAAVEGAYKNTLLTGRYPACVLYLEISPGSVDVNVHPAKTEVKFSDEKRIFDLVYYSALSALQGEDRTAEAELSPSTRAVSQQGQERSRPAAAQERPAAVSAATERSAAGVKSAAPVRESAAAPVYAPPVPYAAGAKPGPGALGSYDMPYQTRMEIPLRQNTTPSEPERPVSTPSHTAPDIKAVEKPVQNVESSPVPDHKIVGEALKTYIIVELDEELILIDKHAAPERMIFDRLKAQDREVMAQTLLAPAALKLSDADRELLEQNGELLCGLGFEIEPIGERDYVVRAVPADMAPSDAAAAVEEICEKLRRGKSVDPKAARDEILHTVACKAAIKAGWDTDRRELERVVDAVLSGRVKYCPHGRPVSVTVTRRELDKMFKRIV